MIAVQLAASMAIIIAQSSCIAFIPSTILASSLKLMIFFADGPILEAPSFDPESRGSTVRGLPQPIVGDPYVAQSCNI